MGREAKETQRENATQEECTREEEWIKEKHEKEEVDDLLLNFWRATFDGRTLWLRSNVVTDWKTYLRVGSPCLCLFLDLLREEQTRTTQGHRGRWEEERGEED